MPSARIAVIAMVLVGAAIAAPLTARRAALNAVAAGRTVQSAGADATIAWYADQVRCSGVPFHRTVWAEGECQPQGGPMSMSVACQTPTDSQCVDAVSYNSSGCPLRDVLSSQALVCDVCLQSEVSEGLYYTVQCNKTAGTASLLTCHAPGCDDCDYPATVLSPKQCVKATPDSGGEQGNDPLGLGWLVLSSLYPCRYANVTTFNNDHCGGAAATVQLYPTDRCNAGSVTHCQ